MPEKTMPEKDAEKGACREVEEFTVSEVERGKSGAWSEDQRERGYYYDDAHGYEIYQPDEEDEEERN